MNKLLDQFREYVAAHPKRCFFGPAATDGAIAAAEAQMELSIPADYRLFLQSFDGGFISLCGESDKPDWDEGGARWNSNHLLGVAGLVAEFTDLRDIWRMDQGWTEAWPYLPFCHTDDQELLVFGACSGDHYPVLDAFHERGPPDWRVLYPNFETLLLTYLDGEGRIRTIAGAADSP